MSLGRRRFLQGSASAGAALLAAPIGVLAGRTAVPADRPILLLRAPGDEPFARAIEQTLQGCGIAAPGTLDLNGKLLGAPGALAATLRAHRGALLIGLMDDHAATLLEETVRDLGGSVWCRGQHRGVLRAGAASRHAFTTVAATAGIGSALADGLGADAAAFLVREHALSEIPAAAARNAALPRAPWPEVLGASYALMAAGRWAPRPVVAELRRGSVADAAGSQPYVSLITKI
jgi:hypothetical protein